MAKILLVEDDNNLREIYEARLMAEGYDIVSARDGEEALTVAMKEKPDLIISDVMMPKISGFDMLDILRTTDETKDAKVIMMTALSQSEDKERAEKLGADRYLVKSQVTLEDVAKVAREVLEGGPAPEATDTTAEATPGDSSAIDEDNSGEPVVASPAATAPAETQPTEQNSAIPPQPAATETATPATTPQPSPVAQPSTEAAATTAAEPTPAVQPANQPPAVQPVGLDAVSSAAASPDQSGTTVEPSASADVQSDETPLVIGTARTTGDTTMAPAVPAPDPSAATAAVASNDNQTTATTTPELTEEQIIAQQIKQSLHANDATAAAPTQTEQPNNPPAVPDAAAPAPIQAPVQDDPAVSVPVNNANPTEIATPKSTEQLDPAPESNSDTSPGEETPIENSRTSRDKKIEPINDLSAPGPDLNAMAAAEDAKNQQSQPVQPPTPVVQQPTPTAAEQTPQQNSVAQAPMPPSTVVQPQTQTGTQTSDSSEIDPNSIAL